MMKKEYRFAIAWTFVILILLSLPSRGISEGFFSILHLDKIVHFSLFGVFAYLWGKATEKKSKYALHIIFLAGSGYGILMEFVQTLPFIARTFDYFDMIANSAGCALIYLFCSKKI